MTNHVHLIGVPEQEDSLALAVGYAHGRYAQWLNDEAKWAGPLWAGRFYSVPMDEPHLWKGVKYVETNPVHAGLAERAQDYPWSSAAAHALGHFDPLLSLYQPFVEMSAAGEWAPWLSETLAGDDLVSIRHCTSTGRPLGSPEFIADLERKTGTATYPPEARAPIANSGTATELPFACQPVTSITSNSVAVPELAISSRLYTSNPVAVPELAITPTVGRHGVRERARQLARS